MCANSWQYLYIPYILIYSVHCIHGGTALIFRTLYPSLYEIFSQLSDWPHELWILELPDNEKVTKVHWRGLQSWIQSDNGGYTGKTSANNLLKMSNYLCILIISCENRKLS